MSIGLCNRDRYILIYKLMFPPDLLHRRLKLLMLQVFLIYANFSRLFHSAILHDLSAILRTYRLAFRLYNTLKIRSRLVLLFVSQFYNIQNTADFQLYTCYELWSIESFDYTNFSEYGIKSFG